MVPVRKRHGWDGLDGVHACGMGTPHSRGACPNGKCLAGSLGTASRRPGTTSRAGRPRTLRHCPTRSAGRHDRAGTHHTRRMCPCLPRIWQLGTRRKESKRCCRCRICQARSWRKRGCPLRHRTLLDSLHTGHPLGSMSRFLPWHGGMRCCRSRCQGPSHEGRADTPSVQHPTRTPRLPAGLEGGARPALLALKDRPEDPLSRCTCQGHRPGMHLNPSSHRRTLPRSSCRRWPALYLGTFHAGKARTLSPPPPADTGRGSSRSSWPPCPLQCR